MDSNLTIQDLFKLILFLLGIGVGTYFIFVLNKINRILGQAKDLLESNFEELDITIKQLPGISSNINEISENINKTIENVSPEIDGLLQNANSISTKVSSITGTVDDAANKAQETIDKVSDSMVETALTFQLNTKTFIDYINILKEVIQMIKKALSKK